jgi:hypothetical protein
LVEIAFELRHQGGCVAIGSGLGQRQANLICELAELTQLRILHIEARGGLVRGGGVGICTRRRRTGSFHDGRLVAIAGIVVGHPSRGDLAIADVETVLGLHDVGEHELRVGVASYAINRHRYLRTASRSSW